MRIIHVILVFGPRLGLVPASHVFAVFAAILGPIGSELRNLGDPAGKHGLPTHTQPSLNADAGRRITHVTLGHSRTRARTHTHALSFTRTVSLATGARGGGGARRGWDSFT